MAVVVVATICALAWMCYRVSSLLNIPIPTLVKLLGLDLPAPPRVSLHGVSADTITLHWSLPDKAGSVAKHIIQINGINVGESEKRGETSVTVTGLNPDQRYNVRVIATNSQNFQAPGQLIRLRTRRKSQCSTESAGSAQKGDSSDDSPSIHSTSDVPPSPHNHHQHSNHGQQHRRTTRERRGSPATLEQSHNLPGQTMEDQHTVESLTRDLDAVRKEIHDLESQLEHTEDEHKTAEAVLRAELDTLRNKKNEEDAGRQRLRADAKALEEARRTAEATRTRTEKALRAKEHEIKKMQDDMAKWEEEKLVALEKVEELTAAARESRENAVTTEKELSSDIQETQKQIAEMEEEIRSLVVTMKTLENQKEQLKADEDREANKAKEDNEKERMWQERQRTLEMRYVTVYNAFQMAEMDFLRSRDMLMSVQDRRGSGTGTGTDAMHKKPKQRRDRNRKSRTHTISSPINAYPVHDPGFPNSAAFRSNSFPQISPTFSNSVPSSPFFNIANGMVTAPPEVPNSKPGTILDPFLDGDNDNTIGGSPMSPTANALLPSNLFAFEDAPPSSKVISPTADDIPRILPFDNMGFMTPQSPLSSGSVSTSPRSSFNRIPLFPSLAGPGDTGSLERTNTTMSPIGSNRRLSSISATAGSIGESEPTASKANSGRRFVNLLSNSFSRQRGKTVGFDASGELPFGTLRPTESHSFPKNDPTGLDPIGTRRRSGSHALWVDSLDFLHSTSRPPKSLERTNSEHSRRSATFNQFNPSFDPIEPNKLFDNNGPVSPRPSSIASFDNPLLPPPSSDVSAAFGWPAPSQEPRNHWADFGHLSRSRPVSRPISPNAGNGSTISLSFFPNSSTNPITNRPVTPRLNPAARTFQSRITTPTTEAKPKKEEKDRDKDKDALSITSATSSTTAAAPSSAGLLSRFTGLSRKGSIGKFTSWGGMMGGGSSKPKDSEFGDALSVTSNGSPVLGSATKGRGESFFGTIGRKKVVEQLPEESSGSSGSGAGQEKEREREKEAGEKKGALGLFRRKGPGLAGEKMEEERAREE